MLRIFLTALLLLFRLLELLLIARAILSWFPITQSPTVVKIYGFIHMVTEPIVSPVRRLLDRIPALRNVPVDLSILGAYLLLTILGRLILLFY